MDLSGVFGMLRAGKVRRLLLILHYSSLLFEVTEFFETSRIIGFIPIWPYIVLQSHRSEKGA
jgi:hypothetical protein